MTAGAEFQTSRLLREAGFEHAFFTRNGGVSEGAYRSLNFSIAVGDSTENVSRNMVLAAASLGLSASRVFFLSQVHGAETRVLDGRTDRDRVVQERGDALLSRQPDLACAVRTADCVPVLLGDAETGAAAAIHAGWRGVVEGIVASAVAELRQLIGADGELVAAIGPHISVARFEVSEEVAERLSKASPASVVDLSREKPHVDLRKAVRAQLNQLGLPNGNIDDVGGCTYDEPELYYSFRRDGQRSGRHLHAIRPRSS